MNTVTAIVVAVLTFDKTDKKLRNAKRHPDILANTNN